MHRNFDPTANVAHLRELQENAFFSMTSSDAGKAALSKPSHEQRALAPIRTSPSSKRKLEMHDLADPETRMDYTIAEMGVGGDLDPMTFTTCSY
jgi:hypothetical protein